MNTIAEETFANVRTVKAFNTESREVGRFSEKNKEVLNLGKRKACYIGILSLVLTIVIWFTMGAIIYFAYLKLKKGELTVGSIMAYMEYMITLCINFGQVAGIIVQMAQMTGAADKVMQLIKYEPKIKIDGGAVLPEEEVNGVIEFRDVRFTYPCR